MGRYVPYNAESETFLNNFFCRFPFGEGEEYPEGLMRSVSKKYWHTTYRSVLEGRRPEWNWTQEDFDEYCSRRSDKHLDQTPEQFFAEIDSTIIEVGLDITGVTTKIREYLSVAKRWREGEEFRKAANNAGDEMCDYLRPIYVALRQKGYNVIDLIG